MTVVLVAVCVGYAMFISLVGGGGFGIGTFLFLPYVIAYAALFVVPACLLGTLGGLATIGIVRRSSPSAQIRSTAVVTVLVIVGYLAVAQFPFEWYEPTPVEFEGISRLDPLTAIAGYGVVSVFMAVVIAVAGRRYVWGGIAARGTTPASDVI